MPIDTSKLKKILEEIKEEIEYFENKEFSEEQQKLTSSYINGLTFCKVRLEGVIR